MWSCVAADAKNSAPSARAKHSATLFGDHVYLLGGRNGNLPTKDFWKYHLVTGKWQQLKPTGDTLPCLQEHTAVTYKDCIYVFGGEVGFSAGTETPLWVYDIKSNAWKKKRTKKGVVTPKGRRGHTALVYNGTMIVYGGYQDLRGSCGELWAYHFQTESWHLLSKTSSSSGSFPPARHKHSSILHNESMWVFGGMRDLQELSDLWKFDLVTKTWHCIKSKLNPGPLHSHAACRLSSGMLIFGGERNGQTVNELWKFNFGLESWEKIIIDGVKPQPRAETVTLVVSALVLNGSSNLPFETKNNKIRIRSCNSADRGNRHSSYLPNNKVAPYEKTYVFNPSQSNYNDGSTGDLAHQYSEYNNNRSRSFLHEIQKLSQIKISNKCSYTVLTGCASDSTESLLKQHASPQGEEIIDTELATPSRGTMVKSKSAYVIKKKYTQDTSPTLEEGECKENLTKKRVEFDSTAIKLPRDPISVPNFTTLTLPTPVLTPVEATKLVYLDSDDEQDFLKDKNVNIKELNQQNIYEHFKPIKRGDSYSSHLGYADNPLYQHMINSIQKNSQENVSSTSDYASIETVNRLSSASNYSVKTNTPQDENQKDKETNNKSGPFGFCNPNYMGPDIKSILNNDRIDKKNVVKLLSNEEEQTIVDDDDDDVLELQNYDGVINKNTKVLYKHTNRANRPPKSLDLNNKFNENKCRALSASRVERNNKLMKNDNIDANLPSFVYVFGGKEQGQVTIFQRPISIWRLKLY